MVNLVTPPSENVKLFIPCGCVTIFTNFLGMKVITELRGKPAECESTHHVECPCAFGFAYRNKRQYYFDIMERWKDVVSKVSHMDEFNTEVFYRCLL